MGISKPLRECVLQVINEVEILRFSRIHDYTDFAPGRDQVNIGTGGQKINFP